MFTLTFRKGEGLPSLGYAHTDPKVGEVDWICDIDGSSSQEVMEGLHHAQALSQQGELISAMLSNFKVVRVAWTTPDDTEGAGLFGEPWPELTRVIRTPNLSIFVSQEDIDRLTSGMRGLDGGPRV